MTQTLVALQHLPTQDVTMTTMAMTIRAHVHNGRLLVDEPTDLPEGTELELVPADDDGEERARLHAAIREGIEDMKAGRTYDAAEVIAELRARK